MDTDILDTPIHDQTSNDTPDPSVTQTGATVESGENATDGAVVASLNPLLRGNSPQLCPISEEWRNN